MIWVTKKRIKVNRAATAWLIRRFIDPKGEIRFVAPHEVELEQRDHGAIGFDAPHATYPHRDDRGRCSFEALVDEHVPNDPALARMAKIVHCADFRDEIDDVPEARGLRIDFRRVSARRARRRRHRRPRQLPLRRDVRVPR